MIIGICGGTGSGKTTIARKVVESIGGDKVVLIEQDSYYIDLAEISLEERRKVNFDHPSSIDFNLIFEHISKLENGYPIEMPIYNFASHTREKATKTVEPKPIVIVEGILIFSQPMIVNLLDTKVFVDTPPDIRLLRRIRRDIQERGRTLEQTLNQYEKTIRPMHFEFVEPFKDDAEIIISEELDKQKAIDSLHELIESNFQEKAIHTTQ